MLLNDYQTGKPLAILDGQTVTAWRTGAVGGVGIRHLAAKDSHTVGIIGAGVQGFYQALYACTARDIHTVYVYNHSNRDLTDYLGRLEKAIDKEGTKVVQCKTVEELAKKAISSARQRLLRHRCFLMTERYWKENALSRSVPILLICGKYRM